MKWNDKYEQYFRLGNVILLRPNGEATFSEVPMGGATCNHSTEICTTCLNMGWGTDYEVMILELNDNQMLSAFLIAETIYVP